MKNQILTAGAITILIVIVIFAAIYVGFSLSRSSGSEQADIRSPIIYLPESTIVPTEHSVPGKIVQKDVAAAPDTTAIPGYDTIRMEAGKQNQTVRLYNPSENNCYFLISISLPDGREIFRSDLIAPGKGTETIRLTSVLDAGIYEEAALIYSCFALDDLHPMNGATVKFTLEVS